MWQGRREMRESSGDYSSLNVLWSLLKRHRKGMLIVFAVVMLLTVLVTFLQTPIYVADSRILIRYGREYTYRPVDPILRGEVQPLVSFNREEILNTEIQIFTSAELIQKVISTIGIETLFPKLAEKGGDSQTLMARAVARFRKKLTVQQIKGAGVLRVSYEDSNPDITVKVVDLLIEYFKERHLEVFKDPRMPFLENQLAVYRKKLEQAKKKLQAFMAKHHIISLKDQQKLLLEQYKEISTLIVQGDSYLHSLDEKIASLTSIIKSVKPEAVLSDEKGTNNDVNTARAQLLTLKLREKDLLQKYKENNRLVKKVREQIEIVEDFLANQPVGNNERVRTGINPLHHFVEQALVEARVQKNSQLAKNEALKKKLEGIASDLEKYGDVEPELNMLMKDVEITESNYENFVAKLEETRILEAMDTHKIVNVVVIEKPIKPIKPVKPKKKINLLVGIILGAALSFAYALFYDHLFRPWKVKQDTRKYVTFS